MPLITYKNMTISASFFYNDNRYEDAVITAPKRKRNTSGIICFEKKKITI